MDAAATADEAPHGKKSGRPTSAPQTTGQWYVCTLCAEPSPVVAEGMVYVPVRDQRAVVYDQRVEAALRAPLMESLAERRRSDEATAVALGAPAAAAAFASACAACARRPLDACSLWGGFSSGSTST